jgi:hypothetical protein
MCSSFLNIAVILKYSSAQKCITIDQYGFLNCQNTLWSVGKWDTFKVTRVA